MRASPSRIWRSRSLIVVLALPLTVFLCSGSLLRAAPPDLTSGGVPDNTRTVNLGATGARGWIYNDKRAAEITGESRQILVTEINAGSPVDGVLAVDDVILGADGGGAIPVAFSADARRSLALAIADAEARDPGHLTLLRWRAGATTTVQITLRTMGSYSATAPYNCPKSSQILQEGLQDCTPVHVATIRPRMMRLLSAANGGGRLPL